MSVAAFIIDNGTKKFVNLSVTNNTILFLTVSVGIDFVQFQLMSPDIRVAKLGAQKDKFKL